jgi:uncharacterized protein (DUF362 family)
MARIVKEVDYIIDMPKMKTHMLAKYTGAIKNLYGLIPGGMKQKLHNYARDEKKFSELLVDIYQNVKPQLTIMDAIVGMEGHGPTSGHPKKAGLILASRNAVALDIAATKIMQINPKEVYHIAEAVKRGFYPNFNFELAGLKKLPLIHFRKAHIEKRKKVIKGLFREVPIVVDEGKCVKCGICAKYCPAKAIRLAPYPVINRKKCIRCFCCMEVCPKHALSLKAK